MPMPPSGQTTQKVDGGPAFPCLEARNAPNEGMTLRDYFAATVISQCNILSTDGDAVAYDVIARNADKFAKVAYIVADALLAERAK